MTLLNPSLTWIIWGFNINASKVFQVLQNNIPVVDEYEKLMKLASETGMPATPVISTKEEWSQIQQTYPEDYPQAVETEGVQYQPQDGQLKIIVPPLFREKLIDWCHIKMFHAGPRKTFLKLKKSYHWTTMYKDITQMVSKCPACALLNAKRNLSHRHYRAKAFFQNRLCSGLLWCVSK